MGIGIQICGLNGCGKSTVGKALAKAKGFHFIDNERLYFPGTDLNDPFAVSRNREEVEKLLMDEVRRHGDFVFAAVKGDYGKEMIPFYNYVVLLEVPKRIRIQRIRDRAFQRFGARMLAGGDLCDQQEAFFRMAESRPEDYVEKWVSTLTCEVIRINGTKPVDESVEQILKRINI